MDLVGDIRNIRARHDYEEDGRANMKALYEVGEEVEVKFIGKISEVKRTETHIFYKIEDAQTGAFGTFQEKQIQELLEPDDFEPEEYDLEGGEDR